MISLRFAILICFFLLIGCSRNPSGFSVTLTSSNNILELREANLALLDESLYVQVSKKDRERIMRFSRREIGNTIEVKIGETVINNIEIAAEIESGFKLPLRNPRMNDSEYEAFLSIIRELFEGQIGTGAEKEKY